MLKQWELWCHLGTIIWEMMSAIMMAPTRFDVLQADSKHTAQQSTHTAQQQLQCKHSPLQDPVATASHWPLAQQVTLAEPPFAQLAKQTSPTAAPLQFLHTPLVRGAVGAERHFLEESAGSGSGSGSGSGGMGVAVAAAVAATAAAAVIR
jgi:hypothetical protein